MKKLVTIVFIILITVLVITSVIKLIRNLSLNDNNSSVQHMGGANRFEANRSIPKWIKRDYLLPN